MVKLVRLDIQVCAVRFIVSLGTGIEATCVWHAAAVKAAAGARLPAA